MITAGMPYHNQAERFVQISSNNITGPWDRENRTRITRARQSYASAMSYRTTRDSQWLNKKLKVEVKCWIGNVVYSLIKIQSEESDIVYISVLTRRWSFNQLSCALSELAAMRDWYSCVCNLLKYNST